MSFIQSVIATFMTILKLEIVDFHDTDMNRLWVSNYYYKSIVCKHKLSPQWVRPALHMSPFIFMRTVQLA